MTRVKRGGRELVVPDTAVAEYLANGYSVIDDQGNVLTRTQAMSFSQLKAEYETVKVQLQGAIAQAEQFKQEIAEKDARIAVMEAKFVEMEAQIASQAAPKAETPAKQLGNTQASRQAAPATKSSTGGKTAQKG